MSTSADDGPVRPDDARQPQRDPAAVLGVADLLDVAAAGDDAEERRPGRRSPRRRRRAGRRASGCRGCSWHRASCAWYSLESTDDRPRRARARRGRHDRTPHHLQRPARTGPATSSGSSPTSTARRWRSRRASCAVDLLRELDSPTRYQMVLRWRGRATAPPAGGRPTSTRRSSRRSTGAVRRARRDPGRTRSSSDVGRPRSSRVLRWDERHRADHDRRRHDPGPRRPDPGDRPADARRRQHRRAGPARRTSAGSSARDRSRWRSTSTPARART